MRIPETSDLWWKTAVIYCLDVQTFMDWNDDGVGDFPGLTERVDYLAQLGVTCLWLMPFHPTTDRDDGYDITDFYGVDPRLGHHGDVVELVRTARDRGMRVIIDLVVNHTSDQHPWFVEARSGTDSRYRDYYVWRSEEPPDTSREVVFPDQEDSIWAYDEQTGEWYLHHFYAHQPDLNINNPKVRDEISKVMGFWMELGISGFRVDAVPFLLGTEGFEATAAGEAPDPHDYLRALRGFQTRRSGDSMMLGEVNLPHEEQLAYFGGEGADELTMVFDFVVMQQMYLSLARRDARPLAAALAERPVLPMRSQWASFVRNHDELTLDKLTADERQEVFDAFGPEESMQLFGRGLRRRLPPMLDGDQQRIRLVYSLMFSLPGTPVLFYGEEIGMGENLDLAGRMAVRSPMQWNDQPNGGFSFAPPEDLVRAVTTGSFSPHQANVVAQLKDPGSLLGFMSRLVHTYRQSPELGWSTPHVLDQPYDAVLAHQCVWDDRRLVLLHNLGASPRTVPLELGTAGRCHLADKLSDYRVELGATGKADVELDGYGYRWMGLVSDHGKQLA